MKRLRQIFTILAGLILILVALLFSAHGSAPPTKLSVVFVGMTNNPARQMTPKRIELCQGATGLCAMFLVSNAAPKQSFWFKTDSIEQKTPTGWQPFVPSAGGWSGVEGSRWTPGYGCLYAVGWPPGLPTNATWRLQIGYGRDPSILQLVVNKKLGWELFRSGKKQSIIPSSEVIQ
jgi:hypothetical protein